MQASPRSSRTCDLADRRAGGDRARGRRRPPARQGARRALQHGGRATGAGRRHRARDCRVRPSLIMFGLPNSALLAAGAAAGLRVAAEGFADRSYEEDGSLTPRSRPGAVIHDPEAVVAAPVRMVRDGIVSRRRTASPAAVDTICVHGDTPGAAELAAVRDGLEGGIAVRACRLRRRDEPSAPIGGWLLTGSAGGAKDAGRAARALRRARVDARRVRRDALRAGPPALHADLGLTTRRGGFLGSVMLLAAAAGGVGFGRRRPLRTDPRADAERAALFDLHVRVRVREHARAVRGLPRLPRHRHGRRLDERRRAGVGVLARGTPRQGARVHAERLGDRLRRGGARQRSCSRATDGGRCSSSASCRRCSRSGSAARQGAGDLDRSRAAGARPRRLRRCLQERHRRAHDRAHADEHLHAVRMVGFQPVASELPASPPAAQGGVGSVGDRDVAPVICSPCRRACGSAT